MYEHSLAAISLHWLCSVASVAFWKAATQCAIASTVPDQLLLCVTISSSWQSLAKNVSHETGIRFRSWISWCKLCSTLSSRLETCDQWSMHGPMQMCSVAASNTRGHGAPGSISSSAVSSTSLYSRYRNTLGSVCSVAVLLLHRYMGPVERVLSEELGGESVQGAA